ncbi:MAG: hypothetical protein ABW252_14905 [Polyangiales bacterium]
MPEFTKTVRAAVLATLGFASFGSDVQADDTPTVGGQGGSPFKYTCPFPDETGNLTGLTGRAGAVIDGFWPICDKEIMSRSYIGGPGGAPFDVRCPDGKYVTGINVYYGQFVNALQLECQGRKDSKPWRSQWVGGTTGTLVGLHCGRDQFAHELVGRMGSYIDSLALDCQYIPGTQR